MDISILHATFHTVGSWGWVGKGRLGSFNLQDEKAKHFTCEIPHCRVLGFGGEGKG